MKKPLISVIIPIYNIKEYVDGCISSVLKQSYTNLEIILVDDGSTDGSAECCDLWADKDARIRVLHQKNQGLSAARNEGTKICTGEYLTYIDGDDEVLPEYVDTLWELTQHGRYTVTQCGYGEYDGDKAIVCGDQEVTGTATSREFLLSSQFLVMATGKLIRREHMMNYSFPVGKIHEDVGTMPRMIYEAGEIAYTGKSLYFYHNREDSINTGSHYYLKHLDILPFRKENMLYYQERGEAALTELSARAYLYDLLDQYQKVKTVYPQEKRILRDIHGEIVWVTPKCMRDPMIHGKAKVLMLVSMILPTVWHRVTQKRKR